MTVLETLLRTRELLQDPINWNKFGLSNRYIRFGKEFRTYCLLGALGQAVANDYNYVAYYEGLRLIDEDAKTFEECIEKLCQVLPKYYGDMQFPILELSKQARVSTFNDAATTSHSDMLKLLDKAIAREREVCKLMSAQTELELEPA